VNSRVYPEKADKRDGRGGKRKSFQSRRTRQARRKSKDRHRLDKREHSPPLPSPVPSPPSFPRKRESSAYFPARSAAFFELAVLRTGSMELDSRVRGNDGRKYVGKSFQSRRARRKSKDRHCLDKLEPNPPLPSPVPPPPSFPRKRESSAYFPARSAAFFELAALRTVLAGKPNVEFSSKISIAQGVSSLAASLASSGSAGRAFHTSRQPNPTS
jgi:hypothetical protein